MAKQVITFHYTLTDKSGKTIDSSLNEDPLALLEGGGQIIPALESALLALKVGDKKNITVPYIEAYGAYDQSLVYQVPRNKLPSQEVKAGDMFQVGKNDHYQVVTVVDVSEIQVTVDANHPLAGQDLNFAVAIMRSVMQQPKS